MNKTQRLLLLVLASLLLSACSEKKGYEEAVLAQMQNESDIKDYKLDPKSMAACVVEFTSKNMPGIFVGDPDRLKAYVAYTKMLSLNKAKNPQQTMTELRNEFGSAQELLKARNNYTESLVECQATLITNAEAVDTPVEQQPAGTAPESAATPPAAPAADAAPTTNTTTPAK